MECPQRPIHPQSYPSALVHWKIYSVVVFCFIFGLSRAARDRHRTWSNLRCLRTSVVCIPSVPDQHHSHVYTWTLVLWHVRVKGALLPVQTDTTDCHLSVSNLPTLSPNCCLLCCVVSRLCTSHPMPLYRKYVVETFEYLIADAR